MTAVDLDRAQKKALRDKGFSLEDCGNVFAV
jgi:hypothetical protein